MSKRYYYCREPNGTKLKRRVSWLTDKPDWCFIEYRCDSASENLRIILIRSVKLTCLTVHTRMTDLTGPPGYDWPELVPLVEKFSEKMMYDRPPVKKRRSKKWAETISIKEQHTSPQIVPHSPLTMNSIPILPVQQKPFIMTESNMNIYDIQLPNSAFLFTDQDIYQYNFELESIFPSQD